MIDFYEELNLDPQSSVAELGRTLTQLESTWKRREINNPEKATKKLALILEARNVFASEASKSEYDHNLAESKKAPVQTDYNAERREKYLQYISQAEKYYFSGNQQDLALEAIRRAQQYYDPTQPDAYFSYLCAVVKCDAGDLHGALSDITDAIVTDDSEPTYYRWKSIILRELYNSVLLSDSNDLQTARSYMAQSKNNAEKALALAEQIGDKEEQMLCLEILADSYSLVYDADYDKAERYANRAIAMGDTKPELQQLLLDIKQDKAEFQYKPYQGKSHPTTSSKSGCYIATAVYGSYDCPEVWALRCFRDYDLAQSFSGRIFIKCYYAISPTLVKLFGNTKWFRTFWKQRLDRFVKELSSKGYSSEKYNDK